MSPISSHYNAGARIEAFDSNISHGFGNICRTRKRSDRDFDLGSASMWHLLGWKFESSRARKKARNSDPIWFFGAQGSTWIGTFLCRVRWKATHHC